MDESYVMKLLKILLLALGLVVLYFVIQEIGFEKVLTSIAQLKWKLLIFLPIYPVIYFLNTLGWVYAYPRPLSKKVLLSDLYLIRIIGETFNSVIPWSGSLGGEPLKATLLKQKHHVPLSESYASLFIVHTTFWISLNVFTIGALLFTTQSMPLPTAIFKSVVAFLLGLAIVALLLFWILKSGIFSVTHNIGKKIGFLKKFFEGKKEKFAALDHDIRQFYTADKKRLALSSLFNFLAWFCGVFEVYFFAKILGMPVSFMQAWLFEALIQVLRIVTFFIPASIGAQEGGIVFLFQQFGYANPISLTFALLRRLRELFWIGIGLTLWGGFKSKTSSYPQSA